MLEKFKLKDEDYDVGGWSLSIDCLYVLGNEIINRNIKDIVEFGSGYSTRFLCDLIYKNGLNTNIDSFENNDKYLILNNEDNLSLKFRNLVECDDDSFDLMFSKKEYDKNLFNVRTLSPQNSQKNCFYEIFEDDLKDCYDLVVLDGPLGNGRSIGFLHIKDRVKTGSLILVDDYSHFHFEFFKKMNKILKTKIIHMDDEFVLVEVI